MFQPLQQVFALRCSSPLLHPAAGRPHNGTWAGWPHCRASVVISRANTHARPYAHTFPTVTWPVAALLLQHKPGPRLLRAKSELAGSLCNVLAVTIREIGQGRSGPGRGKGMGGAQTCLGVGCTLRLGRTRRRLAGGRGSRVAGRDSDQCGGPVTGDMVAAGVTGGGWPSRRC